MLQSMFLQKLKGMHLTESQWSWITFVCGKIRSTKFFWACLKKHHELECTTTHLADRTVHNFILIINNYRFVGIGIGIVEATQTWFQKLAHKLQLTKSVIARTMHVFWKNKHCTVVIELWATHNIIPGTNSYNRPFKYRECLLKRGFN
jgi:hypothetical protein